MPIPPPGPPATPSDPPQSFSQLFLFLPLWLGSQSGRAIGSRVGRKIEEKEKENEKEKEKEEERRGSVWWRGEGRELAFPSTLPASDAASRLVDPLRREVLRWLGALVISLCLTACAANPAQVKRPAAETPPAPAEPKPPPEPFPVMTGLDVLEAQGFRAITGKRVGLLTHAAARNRAGEHSWTVVSRAPGATLVMLFAAEHGIAGLAPASAVIADQPRGPGGFPVYSIYGKSRRPTSHLLKQIDVMVIDLQDIGSRSYTFISAMREALEACFNAGVEVIVLDRPNPLGGRKVDGPNVDPAWRSYVGAFPIPYVHGLTMGELARLALGTPGVLKIDDKVRARAHLTVVPMRGWRRTMRWPETGLTWYPTSPYVKDFASVEGYAMTGLGCLLGGWAHGVGRDDPFRGLYYPGRSADALVKELTALGLPGLAFRKVERLNREGRKIHGVLVDITDWNALRPTELSFHLMRLACAWAPRNPFAAATVREKQIFLRHVGSAAWWEALVREGARVDVAARVSAWSEAAHAFRERSREFWLYPDTGVPAAIAPAGPAAIRP